MSGSDVMFWGSVAVCVIEVFADMFSLTVRERACCGLTHVLPVLQQQRGAQPWPLSSLACARLP